MKKSKSSVLAGKSCTNKENTDTLSQKIEQQNVQKRYQSEFIKYQEQINKVKRLSEDGQAA